MKGRGIAVIVITVVAAAAAASYLWLRPDPQPKVSMGGAPRPFFDSRGRLSPGSFAAAYSPDGSHLAVRSADGIGLAVQGTVRLLGRSKSNVVDFAWMPDGSRLVVVEGPIPTGEIVALGLDGRLTGRASLSPSFSVGTGYGITVNSEGTYAVVSRAQIDQLGGAVHLDLVEVDLQSGAVRELTPTPDVDESAPFFLDDDHVVYERDAAGQRSVALLDLQTLSSRDLTGAALRARPVGVIYDGTDVVYVTPAGDVYALDPASGSPRLMGAKVGDVAAIDPSGSRAVVVTKAAAAPGVDQLVEKRLTPPPKRPR